MTSLFPIGGAETPLNLYAARDLGAHHGTATAVAWSCTAHRLASGGSDGVVKVWAPDKTRPSYNANLQQQGTQQAPERPVSEIRLPTSTPPASAPRAGEQRGRPPRVARLAWHPRIADVLAVASEDGATVRLYDSRTGDAVDKKGPSSPSPSPLVASFAPPSPTPRCTALSLSWCPSPRHGDVVAVGTDADFISFHDVSAEGGGKLLALLPPPQGTEVNEAVFSADGSVFARAAGNAVELFSVEELLSTPPPPLPPPAATPAAAAESWKEAKKAPARPFTTLRGHTSNVFALSTAAGAGAAGRPSGPAAHLVASGGADGAAVVWDLRYGGAPLATCGSFDGKVTAVSLGGGWSTGSVPPSRSSFSLGSLIAYAGVGDHVVVEDWSRLPENGGFFPPRPPTAPHSSEPNPRPYPLKLYVKEVDSVAWAPAVSAAPSESAPKSAAASSSSDGRPHSPRTTKSLPPSSSSSAATQHNAGTLAFTRCFSSPSSSQAGGSGGRGADVVGAIGLFAPPAVP